MRRMSALPQVDDEARAGALRFAETQGGPFLREAEVKRIPPLVALPELLSAAEHVVEDNDTEEDLRLLMAPGSSLGGARPKASVWENDGHLAIAKFHKDDEVSPCVGRPWHSPSRTRLAFLCLTRASNWWRTSRCCCCAALTATARGASRSSPP